MMKNKSMLVIVGFIILALVIVLTSDTVFADAIIIGGNSTENTVTGNTVGNTTANVQNTVTNTTTTPPTTTNTTRVNTTNTANNTQTLPKTGVTDGYVVAILVIVCAISAIYAYRKIRDYNIKD